MSLMDSIAPYAEFITLVVQFFVRLGRGRPAIQPLPYDAAAPCEIFAVLSGISRLTTYHGVEDV